MDIEENSDVSRLVIPSALLYDKCCQIFNGWFKSILSTQEAENVEANFFPWLAMELSQREYTEFQEALDRFRADDWNDLLDEISRE